MDQDKSKTTGTTPSSSLTEDKSTTNSTGSSSANTDKGTEGKSSSQLMADSTATVAATPKKSPGRPKSVTSTSGSAKASKDQTNLFSSAKKDYSQEVVKDGPLYKFFVDALKDIYFAEKHILEALPKMKEAATTEDLQDAFEDHHLITQKQISRLEKVFKIIGEKAEPKKCDAIIGIVKEGENIIKETEEGTMTRDAALIIAGQKVEHYEIASYGGLVALAETLELYKAADLLQTTLEEEEDTDFDLTEIAESSINFRAADENEDDDYYGNYDDEEEDEEDEYEYDDEEDEDSDDYLL